MVDGGIHHVIERTVVVESGFLDNPRLEFLGIFKINMRSYNQITMYFYHCSGSSNYMVLGFVPVWIFKICFRGNYE